MSIEKIQTFVLVFTLAALDVALLAEFANWHLTRRVREPALLSAVREIRAVFTHGTIVGAVAYICLIIVEKFPS